MNLNAASKFCSRAGAIPGTFRFMARKKGLRAAISGGLV